MKENAQSLNIKIEYSQNGLLLKDNDNTLITRTDLMRKYNQEKNDEKKKQILNFYSNFIQYQDGVNQLSSEQKQTLQEQIKNIDPDEVAQYELAQKIEKILQDNKNIDNLTKELKDSIRKKNPESGDRIIKIYEEQQLQKLYQELAKEGALKAPILKAFDPDVVRQYKILELEKAIETAKGSDIQKAIAEIKGKISQDGDQDILKAYETIKVNKLIEDIKKIAEAPKLSAKDKEAQIKNIKDNIKDKSIIKQYEQQEVAKLSEELKNISEDTKKIYLQKIDPDIARTYQRLKKADDTYNALKEEVDNEKHEIFNILTPEEVKTLLDQLSKIDKVIEKSKELSTQIGARNLYARLINEAVENAGIVKDIPEDPQEKAEQEAAKRSSEEAAKNLARIVENNKKNEETLSKEMENMIKQLSEDLDLQGIYAEKKLTEPQEKLLNAIDDNLIRLRQDLLIPRLQSIIARAKIYEGDWSKDPIEIYKEINNDLKEEARIKLERRLPEKLYNEIMKNAQTQAQVQAQAQEEKTTSTNAKQEATTLFPQPARISAAKVILNNPNIMREVEESYFFGAPPDILKSTVEGVVSLTDKDNNPKSLRGIMRELEELSAKTP